MSSAVWPPLPPDQLAREEEASSARELAWLLSTLQENLRALKSGLEECAALLAPTENGSTLVLSSHRSEALKGFVTRVGTRIVKADIKLRLPSLPPPPQTSSSPTPPYYPLLLSPSPNAQDLFLAPLITIRTLINSCLDLVDIATYTGDRTNAGFISSQLKLLSDNVKEARWLLKAEQQPPWTNPTTNVPPQAFTPPLSPSLLLTLTLTDAALTLTLRTLSPVTSPSDLTSLRTRFLSTLSGAKTPTHDEANKIFVYEGRQVRVRDKLRVESQDPGLMSVMAKLGALERGLEMCRRALEVVMGGPGEEFV
ncbi:hypothetical protein K402DRAFT_414751 [Aulographum hederae CBS 113979]|uniref:RAVE subunit 2/Rogdi n=1 Tax=Aulographum hederae CBS 113979 TaxID=1176131 RepID=A0A6G1GQ66_9PEZI|nr:hypothetical protein K402DRAFT_414751 [Aulographum hederae CBS 113979]